MHNMYTYIHIYIYALFFFREPNPFSFILFSKLVSTLENVCSCINSLHLCNVKTVTRLRKCHLHNQVQIWPLPLNLTFKCVVNKAYSHLCKRN